ncbi:hypothetical protein IM793_18295 [Pedobacter sp. MR2016-19]|uniref:sensor histidine kinase n=1 Tax=Pedobacter sp. MR2016-19 TaxID=2780089 RepID=UPI0018773AB0|nr:ATP-binding protein [Pedobacter sp. MR2016-19]MBE5321120.1 hypothetical protein [Pedobacter sp. MR2016-19]
MIGFISELGINILVGCLVGFFMNLIFSDKIKKLVRYHNKELLETRIEIQEQVSHNIASELHDNIGSYQSLLLMSLKRLRVNADEKNRVQFDEAISLAEKTSIEIRNISRSMQAFDMEYFDFYDCLEMELDRLTNSKLLSVNYFLEGDKATLVHQTGLVLFRICQEIINNVVKHAKASTIDVSVQKKFGALILTIADDGIGFNYHAMEKSKSSKRGMGLRTIKSRVEFLHGNLKTQSIPGEGTRITIKIKL